MTTAGERIRARRKELNYTQRELAKIVKVAHVTISQWETEDSAPGGKNLFALSRALRCTPEWLLYGDETQAPAAFTETPRLLSEREEELIDLFASLPESEKENHITMLREKVEDLNKLFEELLQARKSKK
jgi:transcriptional regulator with XRE-family HTH domain